MRIITIYHVVLVLMVREIKGKKMKHTKITLAIAMALSLSACNVFDDDDAPAPPPPPANNAPGAPSLSNMSLDENVVAGMIGTLSATDSDGDAVTFSTANTDFMIEGTNLRLADGVKFDFEKAETVDVEVSATDPDGASSSATFTITVNDVLDFYDFESTNVQGESSVKYTGQTARHVLINDLNAFINTELGDVNAFTFTSRAEVMEELESYFDRDADYAVISGRDIRTSTTPSPLQTTLAEISSSDKDLEGKIAGNDATGQHVDWNAEGMWGWGNRIDNPGAANEFIRSPANFVRELFERLADNADDAISGAVRNDPFGNPINTIYVDEDGTDLKQLIQKFLLMSVAYSQAADDYLDDDTAGKGLQSTHTFADGAAKYTALEHQFDEGFGYFGAARDYLEYTDDEIANKGGRDAYRGYHDTNADGAIDLVTEYNWGQSTNAAKRDRGSNGATNLTHDAMMAFLEGRKLLSETSGTALTDEQMTTLKRHRDNALLAWERSIAATAIHYVNDTITDLNAIIGGDTSADRYADLAKHWSEMKAFAMGSQFNRFSPVSKEQFLQIHTLMGTAPADLTDNVAIAAYIEDLLAARQILQDEYLFDTETVENW